MENVILEERSLIAKLVNGTLSLKNDMSEIGLCDSYSIVESIEVGDG